MKPLRTVHSVGQWRHGVELGVDLLYSEVEPGAVL